MQFHSLPNRKPGALGRGLVSGSIAAVLSTLVLMIRSKKEAKSALSAQNAVSHWIWGEEAKYKHELSVRHTGLGYAIHHASAVFWGVIYERLMRSKRPLPPPAELLRASAFATVANIVDYRLTPHRFKPGFEQHLSKKSLVLVYGAFAVGLAVGHLFQQRRDGDRPS